MSKMSMTLLLLPLLIGSGTGALTSDLDDNGCGSNKGCFRTPADCAVTDCTAIASWVDNGNTIDFEINGMIDNKGYVAIGFSKDKFMGDDSVIACVYDDGSSLVTVKSTWNNAAPKRNQPLADPTAGLSNSEATYSGDRIRCKFTRTKVISGNSQIYDLSKAYYLLLAVGSSAGGNVGYHDKAGTPSISELEISMEENSNVGGVTPDLTLVKVHGSLMIIAWLLCATVGIFTARFYKEMYPGTEPCGKKLWFVLHRVCMITTFTLTITAFIVIFVDVKGFMDYEALTNKALRAHPFMGIIVTLLVIVNPTMAMFRPHPDTPRRPLFNWAHWGVGVMAHTLAIITIFFGVSLPKANVASWAIWVLIVFVVGEILIILIAEMVRCHSRSQAHEQDKSGMEMQQNGVPPATSSDPQAPPGSRALMILHGAMITFCLLIVIVVVVAVALG